MAALAQCQLVLLHAYREDLRTNLMLKLEDDAIAKHTQCFPAQGASCRAPVMLEVLLQQQLVTLI